MSLQVLAPLLGALFCGLTARFNSRIISIALTTAIPIMLESTQSPVVSTDTPADFSVAQTRETSRRPIFGLRMRALLIGIPLVVLIAFISVFADMVSQRVQFGVLQLAPPAIVGLFALVIVNRGLTKLTKQELLNYADVLVIYAMLLVGVMVSTRGVVEKVIPPLAYLPYFATRENKLTTLITPNIPSWMMPYNTQRPNDAPWMRDFFDGVPTGAAIPYSHWVMPLLAWFGLICCVLLVFACLATLLRRQWVDNEQLRFPLTILPLAMIRDEVDGEPFFGNRLTWLGFALSAIVFGINGLSVNFPDWPKFILDLNLGSIFTERPWNSMAGITLYLSLAAVGFAYFLPTDLLFSMWVFFLLTRAQDVFAVQLGGIPTSMVTHSTNSWQGHQAAGAYIVLVLAQLRIAWPYFKQVFQTAFSKNKPLDDRDELMSYRSALIGLTLGFAGIVIWLSIAGMSPWLAMAQMGIYLFFVVIIMSRAVCEAGFLMTETSFLPQTLIRLVYPLENLGATNLSMMAMMNIVFARDLRGILLSPLMDNQKMAGELRVRQRSLLLPLATAFVVSFVVAAFFFLYLSYTKGNLALYLYPNNNAKGQFELSRALIQGNALPPNSTEYGGVAVGIVVTLLLVWARAHFSWFPLHPLAYAIVPTWSGFVFWFPFFIAWIIKSLVLRFGGADLYRRLSPFMLGMILGEFTSAVFWAVMSMPFNGWSAPSYPWT